MDDSLRSQRLNLVNGILRTLNNAEPREKLAEMLADRIEAMVDEKIMHFLRSTGRL